MKVMMKYLSICPGLLLLLGLLLPAAGEAVTTQPATTKSATLQNDDCVKCHAKPPADIEALGMAHKTSVGCQDCHNGHPPVVRKIIPLCSQCHSGEPHFELKNCLECHRNPHTPKVITFGKEVTGPCLTCHTEQVKQLRDAPSKHSALYCSTCHNQHGKIPACTQCHKPHGPEMVATDCKKCHKAHMPKAVTYVNDQIKNADCGACHKVAMTQLAASSFKHQSKGCTFCHVDKHKAVPTCQNCHGVPHPQQLSSRFPTCGACHSIAHDLYKFAPAKGAEAPAKKAAAPAKKAK